MTDAISHPRKCDYRQRAHCNPLSDSLLDSPVNPNFINWSIYYGKSTKRIGGNYATNTDKYPAEFNNSIENNNLSPTILDIGCGFGGLTVALSLKLPDERICGFEIREKVSNYVAERIGAECVGHSKKPDYTPPKSKNIEHIDQKIHQNIEIQPSSDSFYNAAIIRANTMKYLVNFIPQNSVKKIFFCFPDPHFKRSNIRRRIVNPSLLAIYDYCLFEEGKIYIVSDVPDLVTYMSTVLSNSPFFQRVYDESDVELIELIENVTEEGQKARRNGAVISSAVFQKRK